MDIRCSPALVRGPTRTRTVLMTNVNMKWRGLSPQVLSITTMILIAERNRTGLYNYMVIPFGSPTMRPLHNGDSEFIILDVTYDPSDNRWKLDQAFYSAHWNTANDHSTASAWGDLEYRLNPRGYPQAWVALNKHSNYPTEAMCDGIPLYPLHDNCGDPVEGNGTRERFPGSCKSQYRQPASVPYQRLYA